MSATLKDIARRAGLSVPTVSLILNGHGDRFRPESRQAVLDAARELKYRPDSVIRRISTGGSRREAVGFLVRSESPSKLANQPAYEFVCGVNDLLFERNQLMVMLKLSHLFEQDTDAGPPRLIGERFVDGILVETGLPDQLADLIQHYEIPTVWLNCAQRDEHDCVWPDERFAARALTEHLIQLGHRHIAFITSPPPQNDGSTMPLHFSGPERELGYRNAMQHAGLTEHVLDRACNQTDALRQWVRSLLDQPSPRPTAVVSHAFGPALQVIEEARAAGASVPADLSVATVEDLHLLRRMRPELTGMTCDRYAMGRRAAELLLEKISTGKPRPSVRWRGEVIPGTTAAAPG